MFLVLFLILKYSDKYLLYTSPQISTINQLCLRIQVLWLVSHEPYNSWSHRYSVLYNKYCSCMHQYIIEFMIYTMDYILPSAWYESDSNKNFGRRRKKMWHHSFNNIKYTNFYFYKFLLFFSLIIIYQHPIIN